MGVDTRWVYEIECAKIELLIDSVAQQDKALNISTLFSLWSRLVEITHTHGSPEEQLLCVERFVRFFRNSRVVFHETKYISAWLYLASHTSKPLWCFRFMFANQIGLYSAHVYVDYAAVLTANGKATQASKILRLARSIDAQPSDILDDISKRLETFDATEWHCDRFSGPAKTLWKNPLAFFPKRDLEVYKTNIKAFRENISSYKKRTSPECRPDQMSDITSSRLSLSHTDSKAEMVRKASSVDALEENKDSGRELRDIHDTEDEIESLSARLAATKINTEDNIRSSFVQVSRIPEKVEEQFNQASNTNDRVESLSAQVSHSPEKVEEKFNQASNTNDRVESLSAQVYRTPEKVEEQFNQASNTNDRVKSLSAQVSYSPEKVEEKFNPASNTNDRVESHSLQVPRVESGLPSSHALDANGNIRMPLSLESTSAENVKEQPKHVSNTNDNPESASAQVSTLVKSAPDSSEKRIKKEKIDLQPVLVPPLSSPLYRMSIAPFTQEPTEAGTPEKTTCSHHSSQEKQLTMETIEIPPETSSQYTSRIHYFDMYCGLDFFRAFQSQFHKEMKRRLSRPQQRVLGAQQQYLQKSMLLDLQVTVYDIMGKLGEGSYGSVYKAAAVLNEHGDISDTVALKTNTNRNGANEFHILCLLQEQNERKECFVKPVELFVFSDATSILVMEAGLYGSLIDLVNNMNAYGGESSASHGTKGINESLVMYLIVDLAKSIFTLHDRHLLHTDIKADNCLVRIPHSGNHGGVLLIDFGRAIDRQKEPTRLHEATWVSSKGQMKMNNDPMECPNVRMGRPFSTDIDYYGLACVAHTLLFGEHMTCQYSQKQRLWKIQHGMIRSYSTRVWSRFFRLTMNSSSDDLKCRQQLEMVINEMEVAIQGNKSIPAMLRRYKTHVDRMLHKLN